MVNRVAESARAEAAETFCPSEPVASVTWPQDFAPARGVHDVIDRREQPGAP